MSKALGIALIAHVIISGTACQKNNTRVRTVYVGEADCVELLQLKSDSLAVTQELARELVEAYDELKKHRN